MERIRNVLQVNIILQCMGISNGAGDAFVGGGPLVLSFSAVLFGSVSLPSGFLAELINGRDLDKCVKCGCFAAGIVLRHEGCAFPERCDYQADRRGEEEAKAS